MRIAVLSLAAALALAVSPGHAALDEKAALRASQAAIGRAIGDYRMTDTNGREVRFASLRGKPLVVSFVYTGCFQICPATTKHLERMVKTAERAVGPGTFNVATIGFNLPFDTPVAMKDYANKQGVSAANWLFLSPEAASVEALLADFGFVREATAAGFDHLLQVSIVDAEGRVYRQIYGETFDTPQFVGPLVELAQNKPRASNNLAEIIEQIRILCTVYDPSSGRYRVNYAVVIELIVGASVLLVGAVSVTLEWRKRRRVRAPRGGAPTAQSSG